MKNLKVEDKIFRGLFDIWILKEFGFYGLLFEMTKCFFSALCITQIWFAQYWQFLEDWKMPLRPMKKFKIRVGLK